jgi:hypothetical protein
MTLLIFLATHPLLLVAATIGAGIVMATRL